MKTSSQCIIEQWCHLAMNESHVSPIFKEACMVERHKLTIGLKNHHFGVLVLCKLTCTLNLTDTHQLSSWYQSILFYVWSSMVTCVLYHPIYVAHMLNLKSNFFHSIKTCCPMCRVYLIYKPIKNSFFRQYASISFLCGSASLDS